ncbi:MAG: DNA repair protein RecO [Chloroflexi bacterium]|nr:MAG: DNA repair protein RecO [Chloroflexota bacterium]
MSRERLYRTEGIVIRRRNQGEADRVLTLCTPMGKIQLIAKGVRKTRSRKAGHVELFSHSSFVVSRVKNSWDIVSQAETVEPHAALREDLLRGACARYVVELLDRFFTEGEGGPALFDLLNHALTWLGEDDDPDLAIRFYEQHLLALAGFRPELFVCVGEHANAVPLRPGGPDSPADAHRRPYGFDPEHGGALCPDCYAERHAFPAVMALSPNGLWFLQECQRGPYSRLRSNSFSSPFPASLHEEVGRAMHRYITYHLEQEVKADAFLRQLRATR